MQISAKQLWLFCSNPEETYAAFSGCLDAYDFDGYIDEATWARLRQLDLDIICASMGMSENHPGGDEILAFIDATAGAAEKGYKVFTWYGHGTEALAVGYRSWQLRVDVKVEQGNDSGELEGLTILDGPAPAAPTQIAFVLQTGDMDAYPPHGLRVSIWPTMDEVVADMIEFFTEADGQDAGTIDDINKAYHEKDTALLMATLRRSFGQREWAIYSQGSGYHYLPIS